MSSEHQTPNNEGVVSSRLQGVQIQLTQSHSPCPALAGEEAGAEAAAPHGFFFFGLDLFELF